MHDAENQANPCAILRFGFWLVLLALTLALSAVHGSLGLSGLYASALLTHCHKLLSHSGQKLRVPRTLVSQYQYDGIRCHLIFICASDYLGTSDSQR